MRRVEAEKGGLFAVDDHGDEDVLVVELGEVDGSNTGSKYLPSTVASPGPMRKLIMVPTLPKTASRTTSGIWETYWLATVRLRPYLRASDRMTANESVAKFWNSST
jgi:hypothetical protein